MLSSMTLNEIPAKVLFGDKWIGNKWVRWQEQVLLFFLGVRDKNPIVKKWLEQVTQNIPFGKF